jgi:hypothetical protein
VADKLFMLAQMESEPVVPVLLWSGAIMVVVFIAYFFISTMRKKIKQEDPTGAGGFTLMDLRRLKQEGALTDEEFEKAKTKIVESAKRALERDAAARVAAAARAAKDR